MKIILSSVSGTDFAAAVDDRGRIAEMKPVREWIFNVGDVILGRVADRVPGIGAAFVRLVPSGKAAENAYLASEDTPDGILPAPERVVPVQIKTLPHDGKPARVTMNITLGGRFLVALTGSGEGALRISKKIKDLERTKLKEWMQSVLKTPESSDFRCGFIVRTEASGLSGTEEGRTALLKEMKELSALAQSLFTRAGMRTDYSLLYRAPDALSAMAESFRPEEIILDTGSGFDRESTSLPAVPVREYSDPGGSTYLKVMGYGGQLRTALERKVWLKSGAFLVIDCTEAMTVIDVNSGKHTGGHKDVHALEVNLEAAEEIFMQIRLRNLSGIIVVDFINMDRAGEEELGRRLSLLAKKDPVQTDFIDFTPLGLAEITRKREGRPLKDYLFLDK